MTVRRACDGENHQRTHRCELPTQHDGDAHYAKGFGTWSFLPPPEHNGPCCNALAPSGSGKGCPLPSGHIGNHYEPGLGFFRDPYPSDDSVRRTGPDPLPDVFDEVLGAVEEDAPPDPLKGALQALKDDLAQASTAEMKRMFARQATALRQRAESAELGCEIAYRREPTQEEGDAHEHVLRYGHGQETRSGECFVPMGGWTGRRCRVCARWVWGGPTACLLCVAREEYAALSSVALSALRDSGESAQRVKELEQRASDTDGAPG